MSMFSLPLPELALPAMGRLECAWAGGAELGEGALWSGREQALYWVDILGKRLHRMSHGDGGLQTWPFEHEVSAVAERLAHPGLLLALRPGLALWDPSQPGQPLEWVCQPERTQPANRLNDGKCDAQGRFWAGSMDFAAQAPSGALYRVGPGGQTTRMVQGLVVANGPTWSREGRTLYLADTVTGRVLAYDFDPEAGSLTSPRIWLALSPADGLPDGMCTDAAGRIWLCHWGGACVSCHHPLTAQELGRIRLPVSQVTSCAFGGPALKTLYITSARAGLSAEALAREPLAGALFRVDSDEPGLPAHGFGA